MDNSSTSARFPLGRVVATPGALEALAASRQSPAIFLARHVRGDFGDLDEQDRRLNEEAIQTGERILSAYVLASGERLWIITEADRSSTSCLLPTEY